MAKKARRLTEIIKVTWGEKGPTLFYIASNRRRVRAKLVKHEQFSYSDRWTDFHKNWREAQRYFKRQRVKKAPEDADAFISLGTNSIHSGGSWDSHFGESSPTSDYLLYDVDYYKIVKRK